MFQVLHAREDGTFVINWNGYPYHVEQSDPLFAEVALAYAQNPDATTPETTPQARSSVPHQVTRFQARMVLRNTPGPAPYATLFDAAEAFVTATGGTALFAWEEAGTFERNGTLINEFANQFGITEEQLDALFVAAAAVSA